MHLIKSETVSKVWLKCYQEMDCGVTTLDLSSKRPRKRHYVLTRKEFDAFCKNLHKRREFILAAGLWATPNPFPANGQRRRML